MKIFDKRTFLKHQSVLQWNNLVQSDKNFPTEKRDTPYYEINFSKPQIFWNIEGLPPKLFSTVRPKLSEGKTWYPLICIKFFATPKFLKHSREAHKIFSHCETQIFRRKTWYPLFSSTKPFKTGNFLKNSRTPLRNF